MKKSVALFSIGVIIFSLALGSCSSENKKKAVKSEKHSASDKLSARSSTKSPSKNADIPNPCEVVELNVINSVLYVPMVQDDRQSLKSGNTQYCTWVSAGDDQYKAKIVVTTARPGSNLPFEAIKNLGNKKDYTLTELNGTKIYSVDVWTTSLFEKNGVLYSIQVIGNQKDFSGDSRVPEGLLKNEPAYLHPASDLAASYLIASDILSN